MEEKSINKEIIEPFKKISDSRCACDVKIPVFHVVIITLCALMSRIEKIEEIAQFAEGRATWFEKHFGIGQIPSESSLRRILGIMNPMEVGVASLSLIRKLLQVEGDIVAIDGKAIRTSDRLKGFANKLRILSAYETETSVTVGQVEVGDKTNEITAMLDLLELLNLEGRIVTADAMHCQWKTCQRIVEKGGDYVIQVKGNQQGLYEDIKDFMDDEIATNSEDIILSESEEKNHGRWEKRQCYISRNVEWLENREVWSSIQLLIAMDRTTIRDGKQTQERSYYISSLVGTAAHVLRIIREHWQIESLHWSLDVVFHEDGCRERDTRVQMNLNIFRKLVLALHRNYVKKLKDSGAPKTKNKSNKSSMIDCLLNPDHMLKIFGQEIEGDLKLG